MDTWTKTLSRLRLGTAMGPVRWARWGPLSTLLARAVPRRKPTLLVISLPRSGSSWVGQVLGDSPGALYLREPMTQTWLEGSAGKSATDGEDGEAVPAPWKAAARDAFRGLPRYRSRIVVDASQWSLLRRPQRRVVIKEVRARALGWLLQQYAPRVVFLVRHPAAVGLSAHRLGWAPIDPDDLLGGWRRLGRRYGEIVKECLTLLDGRDDARIVLYEDLCVRPVEMFRDLYAFADLPWTPTVAEAVCARSTAHEPGDEAGDEAGTYGLRRNSRAMVERWRRAIRPDVLEAMAEGWLACGVPLYLEADWQPL